MRPMMLDLLAVMVIAGGAGHLLAQTSTPGGESDEAQICCTSANEASKCCGKSQCRAGADGCCSDGGCDKW